MNQIYILGIISIYLISCNGFILVPEELQTLANLLYSRLPIIRTGTSSKVGMGFRIGKNADFQVLFEIGPQTSSTTEIPIKRETYTKDIKSPNSLNNNDMFKKVMLQSKKARRKKNYLLKKID